MNRTFYFLVVMVVFTVVVPAQNTLLVPAQFPTPAVALFAAANGDLILVSPGIYIGIVDYIGKAVEIRSTDGPDVTILMGPGFGTVVCFISGESPTSPRKPARRLLGNLARGDEHSGVWALDFLGFRGM